MRPLRWLLGAGALVLLAGACAGAGRDHVRVEVLPGPHSVLSAVVQVDADTAVQPTVVAIDGEGHRVEVPTPPAARHHAIPLVGLRAERTSSVEVTDETDGAVLASRELTTGALPDDLPEVVVEADERARPGYTLFNASAGDGSVEHPGNLIAVDETGEVVWYLQAARSLADVRQLPDGHLIANHDSTGAREFDLLGNVVREWTTTARVDAGRVEKDGTPFYTEDAFVVDTVRLHHEVAFRLPSGSFLALGMEVRRIDGFPTEQCATEDALPPGSPLIRGDVVLEYTPTGEVVRRLPLLDAVDPVANPGVARCESRTDPFVEDREPYVDWTHGNSVQLFPRRNLVLVSARHLNQVLALRWDDDAEGPAGELLWSLGEGGDFDLVEGEWFVQQHAPEWLDDGTILVYDNGTERPGTIPAGGAELPYSRAVIYEVEPPAGPGQRGTARQVWEHRIDGPDGTPEYAAFLGDADMIGDDHVLITHGAMESGDNYRARIIEVDRVTGDVVLDINLPAGDVGWRTYRAEHLDTWYP